MNPTQTNTPMAVNQQAQNMLKQFGSGNNKSPIKKFMMPVLGLVIILAGVGVGWLITNKGASSGVPKPSGVKVSENEAGINDEDTFGDTAIGKMVAGGMEGEGTFHLEREGGPSKFVYLTSTVIDISKFEGKNVQVWGETIAAKSAPWLMDVGKIKIVE